MDSSVFDCCCFYINLIVPGHYKALDVPASGCYNPQSYFSKETLNEEEDAVEIISMTQGTLSTVIRGNFGIGTIDLY